MVKTIVTPMPAEFKENPNRFNLNKNWFSIMNNEAKRVFTDYAEGVLDS